MNQLTQQLAQSSEGQDLPAFEHIVSDVSALITPPTVCVKMYDLVRSGKATAADIGSLVASDPNLTGRLLKIVNSAYYSFSASIDTIERAVTVIGVRDLYNLVLAITAARSFSGLNSGLISMEAFWRHSVMCGLTARELARALCMSNPERFFVAGLLHDIGLLVMYHQLDEHVADMRAQLDGGERALYAAELERFGFSHACVGAAVLAQWALPESLLSGVRLHHNPADAQPTNPEAALIHLADWLSSQSTDHSLHPDTDTARDEHGDALKLLGIDSDTFSTAAVVEQAQAAFSQSMRDLMP